MNNSADACLVANQEDLTLAQKSISTDHSYIHDGIGFSQTIETASIEAAGAYKISIATGTTKYLHMRAIASSSTANIIEIELLEAPTNSSGTAVTMQNRNRNSSTTSTATVKQGVASTGGTSLGKYTAGAGGGVQARSGGSVGGENDERVLKQNTDYAIVITNIGATTATVGYISLFWYEEARGEPS